MHEQSITRHRRGIDAARMRETKVSLRRDLTAAQYSEAVRNSTHSSARARLKAEFPECRRLLVIRDVLGVAQWPAALICLGLVAAFQWLYAAAAAVAFLGIRWSLQEIDLSLVARNYLVLLREQSDELQTPAKELDPQDPAPPTLETLARWIIDKQLEISDVLARCPEPQPDSELKSSLFTQAYVLQFALSARVYLDHLHAENATDDMVSLETFVNLLHVSIQQGAGGDDDSDEALQCLKPCRLTSDGIRPWVKRYLEAVAAGIEKVPEKSACCDRVLEYAKGRCDASDQYVETLAFALCRAFEESGFAARATSPELERQLEQIWTGWYSVFQTYDASLRSANR